MSVRVRERERGPLVLSDSGIRSEVVYLSLSDSLCLVSPTCQDTHTDFYIRSAAGEQQAVRDEGRLPTTVLNFNLYDTV